MGVKIIIQTSVVVSLSIRYAFVNLSKSDFELFASMINANDQTYMLYNPDREVTITYEQAHRLGLVPEVVCQ